MLFLDLTSGDNADKLRMLQSSLPSETDRDRLTKIDGLLDLWYGLQGAVRRFAEWTKSRMDALSNFFEDDQFVTAVGALQLPQNEKVTYFVLLKTFSSMAYFGQKNCSPSRL